MKLKLTKKQWRWGITLLVSIFLIYVWPHLQGAFNDTPAVPHGWYYVSEVYDGDTIGVMMNSTIERIRLIGVDTPETHHPDRPPQCYGEHATKATKDTLLHKNVRLMSDATNDNRDRYDRLLRYVYTEDAILWNQELIRRGEGFAYISFPFIHKTIFQTSQFEAAREKRGLWGECQTAERGGRWETNDL